MIGDNVDYATINMALLYRAPKLFQVIKFSKKGFGTFIRLHTRNLNLFLGNINFIKKL